MSTVLDPHAFNASRFEHYEDYRHHVSQFLKAIIDNIYVVVDSEGTILAEWQENIDALPPKYRNTVKGLFTEVRSPGKRRIVPSPVKCKLTAEKDNVAKVAMWLFEQYDTDAVIADDVGAIADRLRGVDPDRIVLMSEYLDSPFEINRWRMTQGVKPICELPHKEAEEAVYRAIRFSRRLEFYDQYIGNGAHPENFVQAIAWIVSLWSRSVYVSHAKKTVELYTVVDDRSNITATVDNVMAKLIKPLEQQCGLAVAFYPKVLWATTDRKLVHARYLKSDTSILMFDPGFDFVKNNGSFHYTEVKRSELSEDRVNEWRSLPSAI